MALRLSSGLRCRHRSKVLSTSSIALRCSAPSFSTSRASCSRGEHLGALEHLLAGAGQPQRVRPPVGARIETLGQAALFELVQQPHQPRPLDAQRVGEIGLRQPRIGARSPPAPNIAPDGCRSLASVRMKSWNTQTCSAPDEIAEMPVEHAEIERLAAVCAALGLAGGRRRGGTRATGLLRASSIRQCAVLASSRRSRPRRS